MKKLELLAPARNLQQGKMAIDAGADAVYIGYSRFGARAQAGNSLDDITQLVAYAHLFGVKVFVAFNTILYENELAEAEKSIHQLHDAGVDALIVQDMGILEMILPPITLHASTQTNNATIEKVKFLEGVGFTRVVLARELSINEIAAVCQATSVEIEAFIHGALCVSYSGQCYISQHLTQRSGNRGECAQICRGAFTLTDDSGKVLAQDKHLLSLKDFNASASLSDLVAAGVTSFKIEGRLKDATYVVTTVSWYRKQLDDLIARNPEKYERASFGSCQREFVPDLNRSFNRGYTSYFLNNRQQGIFSPDTPKALGQMIGTVDAVEKNRIKIRTSHALANGDGLCFFDKQRQLQGFRVNKVEGGFIYPAQMVKVELGAVLYRNNDLALERQIEQGVVTRKITVSLTLTESESGVQLHVCDENGIESCIDKTIEKQVPKNPEANKAAQTKQLSKLGDTNYVATDCKIACSVFLPISQQNELRRDAIANHTAMRASAFRAIHRPIVQNDIPFPEKTLDYTGNVSNTLAQSFYKRHGVIQIAPAFELDVAQKNRTLMTMRHCLRYELQLCPVHNGAEKAKSAKNPLWLHDNTRKFKLEFDCKNCVMKLLSE